MGCGGPGGPGGCPEKMERFFWGAGGFKVSKIYLTRYLTYLTPNKKDKNTKMKQQQLPSGKLT